MKVKVVIQRVLLCGGGTAYDVYVSTSQKVYRPIAGGTYATIIMRGENSKRKSFYSLTDFLRSKELDALPYATVTRWDAFVRVERIAKRLEKILATKAFPELRAVSKLSIWEDWNLPSAEKTVTLNLNERNAARLAVISITR